MWYVASTVATGRISTPSSNGLKKSGCQAKDRNCNASSACPTSSTTHQGSPTFRTQGQPQFNSILKSEHTIPENIWIVWIKYPSGHSMSPKVRPRNSREFSYNYIIERSQEQGDLCWDWSTSIKFGNRDLTTFAHLSIWSCLWSRSRSSYGLPQCC